MSFHSTVAAAPTPASAALSSVRADISYLVRQRERPYHYTFERPSGGVRTNAVYAPHRMAVADARPLAGGLSLDREGFALIEHASAVADFDDDDEVRRVYYPEA